MVTLASKRAKEANKARAVAVLKGAGLIDYVEKNNKTAFIFRDPAGPSVDYYPTTNKWRHRDKTNYGTPEQFVKWYLDRCTTKEGLASLNSTSDGLNIAYAEVCEAVRTVMDKMDKLGEVLRNADGLKR